MKEIFGMKRTMAGSAHGLLCTLGPIQPVHALPKTLGFGFADGASVRDVTSGEYYIQQCTACMILLFEQHRRIHKCA